MSLPVEINPHLLASSAAQYKIERSLRFNSADSAYLNRTPASAGNRKTFTISAWVKRSSAGTESMMCVGTNTSDDTAFTFNSDKLYFLARVSSSIVILLDSTAVHRDFSAWYHVVAAIDTTQATGSNRVKLYVNGTQITAFGTATYPDQNQDLSLNNTVAHEIGRVNNQFGAGQYFNGYMTEINFIDGQQLTPSSFGETDTATGVWKPKAYSGSYGTNGFYLKFADNSGTTSTTLGKDSSGNSNNWTPNNFSVTAGAGNDSLVDTPTPYGTDTGAGGEVRGNYATLNPLNLKSGLNLANGNMSFSNTGNANRSPFSTIGMTSGKWYCEVKYSSIILNVIPGVVYDDGELSAVSYIGNRANGYGYESSGLKYNNGSGTSYGASWTTSNTIGIALDLDNGTVVFYKDGVSQGTAFSSLPSGKTWFFGFDSYGNGAGGDVNFGQRPFAYTAPSGFKALVTTNLPTPTIGATAATRADDYFNTVLYTGTSANQSVAVGFQPDFVWIKSRSNTTNHALFDAVRGADKWLLSNATNAESSIGLFPSFDSNGFTVSNVSGNYDATNYNTYTYASWNWKANGAGSSDTSGSVTSTVSANQTAGFSIVSFASGASGDKTAGHGLGVAPSFIIMKSRDSALYNWSIYHASVATTVKKYLAFTTDALSDNGSNIWGSAFPTSTVFGFTSGNGVVASTNCIAYCFAPVAGYSAFGSYYGNGADDGPFIYTGFRPAFMLVKRSSSAGEDWWIFDNKRDPFNIVDNILAPSLSGAEISGGTYPVDFVSNGWKIRGLNALLNTNGALYAYAAFAESPFKYALAR